LKEKMLVLNESNFGAEVVNSTAPVLVDFFATWCQPCNMLSPVLEKLSKEFRVGKVNTEENQDLSERYRITALPTLVFFRDGKELKRIVGLASEAKIRDTMKEVQTL
jgi:thioredoxin 1